MSTPVRIDARGLKCPLPVLRLRKVLLAQSPGAVVEILADDPIAAIDIPHFCAEEGHDVIEASGERFVVRRDG